VSLLYVMNLYRGLVRAEMILTGRFITTTERRDRRPPTHSNTHTHTQRTPQAAFDEKEGTTFFADPSPLSRLAPPRGGLSFFEGKGGAREERREKILRAVSRSRISHNVAISIFAKDLVMMELR
jgi:hypothetical protein